MTDRMNSNRETMSRRLPIRPARRLSAIILDWRAMHIAQPSSGEVAEWLKAAASKAVVRASRTAGSNPALSAIFIIADLADRPPTCGVKEPSSR